MSTVYPSDIHDPDQTLVAASQEGNRHAFNELVLRHKDRLYTVAFRLLSNPGDAEEVSQEAFLRAYEKLEEFRGEAKFSTWLYQICRNLSLNRLEKKTEQLGDEATPDIPAEAHLEPPAQVLARERQAVIGRALANLKPEFREVILLYHKETLSYEEIADVLDLPIGTIRSRLHRGRSELRDLLRPYLHTTS